MPKHLYLLRHAEAAEKLLHQQDLERELTPAGKNQSLQMGAYLLRENQPIDVMISSDALRAKQTAALTADKMQFESSKVLFDHTIYDATARTFLSFINSLDEQFNSVIIVGHNPALSYLAEYLTKSEIGNIVPAGMVIIKFNLANWSEVSEGNGALEKYVYPGAIGTN